jgi:hypothetical protein
MDVDRAQGFFRENYAVAEFADGGVLVDLSTGAYFHLNHSALDVLRALRTTPDRRSALQHLSDSTGLPWAEAEVVIDQFVADLASPVPRFSQPERFNYVSGKHGYDVLHRDRRVLSLTADGLWVSVPDVEPDDAPPLADRLKAATPKILFLQKVPVLHAAACLTERGLVAFSGLSGAGKTTSGRAFAATGRRLISEDILVLSPDTGPQIEAFADGESAAHVWASQLGASMTREGAMRACCSDLAIRVTSGPRLPLERVLFLDRHRRAGDAIRTRRLSQSEALLALMTNNFLAGADSDTWRQYLDAWALIARSIQGFEAVVPPDLRQLEAALGDYSERAASKAVESSEEDSSQA